MIRLEKLTERHPEFGDLIRALESDRVAYLAAKANNRDTRGLLRHYTRVKPAVKCETNEKCAYCESKVTDIYPGDVEHILPKAPFPDKALEYANLTFVCWLCNNKKRDALFDDGYGLLDPYEADPTEYLRFFGTTLVPIPVDPQSLRAKRTIDAIDLNRPSLMESRKQSVEKFELLEHAYRGATIPAIKTYCAERIRDAQAANQPYSLLAKCYFRHAGIIV